MESWIEASWKPLAYRGLAGILLGVVAFLWPLITLFGLVLLFGLYAFTDGLLALTVASHHRARVHVWALALEGLIGLAFGLAAFLWTGITALVLVNLIATWAVVTGVLEIALSVRLHRDLPGAWLLMVAGGCSGVLGVLMLLWPAASALVLVFMLGGYAFSFGTAMLALAIRLRRLTSQSHSIPRDLHGSHRTA
jgi:uncharacterized membrane protein HdeD (DUF308 family)